MQSMMFGPTCSPACAQFVKDTHAETFRDKCPEAVEGITKFTYVENYFNSHSTIAEALRVSKDAINIFADIKFDLVAFESNSSEFLQQLPAGVVKDTPVNVIDPQAVDLTKILGLSYDPKGDVFTFRLTSNETLEKMLNNDLVPSKREVLRIIMRIFDPLGLISHFTIRGKVILQEIWREGSGWDEDIPNKLTRQWAEYISELRNIEKLRIPRLNAPVTPSSSRVELVVFVDASESAFGAVAYFRITSSQQVYVSLAMSKGKVAPIKQLSIPQLELQAAVSGVRLAKAVKVNHSFAIDDTIFLSDSKTTLSWICTTKYNFKSFVAVRVGEILESSSRRQWYHIGTKDNVADEVIKYFDPCMSDDQSRWFKGPEYLKLPFGKVANQASSESSNHNCQHQEVHRLR